MKFTLPNHYKYLADGRELAATPSVDKISLAALRLIRNIPTAHGSQSPTKPTIRVPLHIRGGTVLPTIPVDKFHAIALNIGVPDGLFK